MAGLRSFREAGDAYLAGQFRLGHLRKVPSQASTAGWWVDLSMAAGNPVPNYYASDPLVAATLNGFRGICHGSDVSPAKKHLQELTLCTPTAGLVGRYMLLDYLIYYPFVDLDSADEQAFDNAVTLPRYATGDGVQAMLVAAAPTTGGGSFSFNYIDQDGNPQTAPSQSCSVASAPIASLVTSEQATAAGGMPFLKLASGSRGIRSVTSLTMAVPNGGLGALVLVKPLAEHQIYEANVPRQLQWLSMLGPPPAIEDGAYLNLIMNCAATVASGTLTGFARFGWN